MTVTSEEAKKDEHIEEYLRLRKVWAKYVDGLVERAGTKPGRMIILKTRIRSSSRFVRKAA